MEFEPRQRQAVWMYVTSGMSERVQSNPNNPKWRTELLAYSTDRANTWIVEILLMMSLYPFRENTVFESGQTILYGEPIRPTSHLTSFLFLNPVAEISGFQKISNIEGYEADCLWVLPITEAERGCVIDRGLDAFIQVLREQDVETIANCYRESFI